MCQSLHLRHLPETSSEVQDDERCRGGGVGRLLRIKMLSGISVFFSLKLKLRFSQQGKFVQMCSQVTAESQLFSIPSEAVAAALWLPLS